MTERVAPVTSPGLGLSLDDWLEEEGMLEEVEASALAAVAAYRAERAAPKPGVGRPVGRRSKAAKQP